MAEEYKLPDLVQEVKFKVDEGSAKKAKKTIKDVENAGEKATKSLDFIGNSSSKSFDNYINSLKKAQKEVKGFANLSTQLHKKILKERFASLFTTTQNSKGFNFAQIIDRKLGVNAKPKPGKDSASAIAKILNEPRRRAGGSVSPSSLYKLRWSEEEARIQSRLANLNAPTVRSRADIPLNAQQIEAARQRVSELTKNDRVNGDATWWANNAGKSTFADKISNFRNSLKAFGEESKSALSKVGEAFKKSTKKASNFFASLRRIALYRAIRFVLKEITNSFKEGVNNAYQWSKVTGGTLSKSLDSMASSFLYLRNSIGASLEPILNALTPVIESITNSLADLFDKLSQVVARLSGQNYWLKAIRTQTEFAKQTGKAANAVKNLVFGFDELNIISANSGNDTDYSTMFEKVAFGDNFDQSYSGKLAITMNDVLFEWGHLNGEQIAEKAFGGLNLLLGGVIGFGIGGPGGAVIGAITGVLLSVAFSSALFDHDGVLNGKEVASMVAIAAGGLLGGVITMSPVGAAIGASIVSAFLITLTNPDFNNGLKLDKDGIAALIKPALIAMGMVAGAGILGLAAGPQGALLGMTIGAAIMFSITDVDFSTNKGKASWLNKLTGLFGDSVDYWDEKESAKISYSKINPASSLFSKKASGGFVPSGSLFIAGEAGAEIISAGSHGANVSNTDQIAQSVNVGMDNTNAILMQTASAIISAINNKDTATYLDGTELSRRLYSGIQNEGKRRGTSLVQGV